MDGLALTAVLAIERYASLIDLGIAGLFSVIGVILNRSSMTVHRSTFVALWGVILVLSNAVALSAFMMKEAILAGLWWVLILLNVFAGIVAGFTQGYLAAARSRDFSSNRWWGFLVAIPILNLILALIKPKPGRVDVIAERYPIVVGWTGVFIGIVLMFAAIAFSRISDEQMEFSLENPDDVRVGLMVGVQLYGLPGVLQQAAAESSGDLPFVVDEFVTLTRIEAEGTELRRVYFLKYEGGKLEDEGSVQIRQSICTDPFDRELLGLGASIRETFVLTTGAPFGDVVVTAADCLQN